MRTKFRYSGISPSGATVKLLQNMEKPKVRRENGEPPWIGIKISAKGSPIETRHFFNRFAFSDARSWFMEQMKAPK